jgi:cation diffusion facilitator family transporter
MIRFLIKRFVQDYENVSEPEVRAAYGMLSGTLGLINNFVLFALKLTVGLVINSIAVISDAFNNLSDFCTSLIQIFGVKMSCKPPDKNHPQGHGRSEYIASLAVAFVIFSVGTRLFGSSFVIFCMEI